MSRANDDKFKACVGHLSQDLKAENIKYESVLTEKEPELGHLWCCAVTLVCDCQFALCELTQTAKLHPSGRVQTNTTVDLPLLSDPSLS